MAKSVDIKTMVGKMLTTHPVGPDDLTMWGGGFEAEALETFLGAWDLPRAGMPWSIWQWTDVIRPGHQAAQPSDLDYLERGRVFGKQGDLELRREGDRVLWRFIGPSIDPDPVPDEVKTTIYGAANYWHEHGERGLRPYERTALLWGADDDRDGRWYEDRVGRADLKYPEMEGRQVVQVRYIEYLHGGDVEFVRLLGLEPGPDRPKGGHNV